MDWKALVPDRITDQSTEQDGQLVRVYSGMSGVTYNTRLAPMKPTTLADFLRPEWKGKIASTPYWIIAHPETTKTKRAAIKILTTKAKK